jgi:uncharacterized protein
MEKIDFKEPLTIVGFVSAGLVAQTALNHLINKLNMKEIAHVMSRHVPPSVLFVDGELKHPFRICSNQEGTLCGVVCDTPLPSAGAHPIASALVDWAEKKGIKELVVLEGFPLRGMPKERQSFCAAEPEKRCECERKGMKMLSGRMVIHGIASGILSECLTRRITGMALMTPAIAFMPDPGVAATLVVALNKVYDLQADTSELLEKAVEIKRRLREVAENYQRMSKGEEKR